MRVIGKSVLVLGFGLFCSQAAFAQTGPQSVGASAAAAPAKERRICRTEVETGSLARRKRQCFTKAEWDVIAQAARENGQDMVDKGMTRPAGGT